MNIAVVAYPSLCTADRGWIEAFRARHDPQSSKIRVHFTLVFPVDVAPGEVVEEIHQVATTTEVVTFAVHRAAVVRDAFRSGYHIFLVPDEGANEIAALHDRLYAGALKTQLYSGAPFVPHMTIGTARDRETAERLAAAADVSRAVRGTVGSLTLVNVGEASVATIATYDLAGRTHTSTCEPC